MASDEIVLPITEPETEWVRGRALQKVSPTRRHARLQMRLGTALDAWAKGLGEVGPEWRFRVAPPGEARRPLVPDLAFVRNERLCGLSLEEADAPGFAPDVAVEIRSLGDRETDIAEKVAVYLRAGSALVLVVDPERRVVSLFDSEGAHEMGADDCLQHAALPGFSLPLHDLFSVLECRPANQHAQQMSAFTQSPRLDTSRRDPLPPGDAA